jgi:hypothetical protein
VADLTGRNANVFYELAVRHAIRRPYVQIIDRDDTLPFDLSGARTIQFSLQDPDSVEFVRTEIAKQMKSMMGTAGPVESPISAAVDLNTLSKSKDPDDRRIGEVLSGIAELKQQIGSLKHQVRNSYVLDALAPDDDTILRRLSVLATKDDLRTLMALPDIKNRLNAMTVQRRKNTPGPESGKGEETPE